jgi:hypothetical protein
VIRGHSPHPQRVGVGGRQHPPGVRGVQVRLPHVAVGHPLRACQVVPATWQQPVPQRELSLDRVRQAHAAKHTAFDHAHPACTSCVENANDCPYALPVRPARTPCPYVVTPAGDVDPLVLPSQPINRISAVPANRRSAIAQLSAPVSWGTQNGPIRAHHYLARGVSRDIRPAERGCVLGWYSLVRIGKAAAALHPGKPDAAREWADGQKLRVLHGRAKAVAATLASVAARVRARNPRLDPADADRAVTYLTNNHQHMRYDKALAAGWPIATGLIEGSCRFVEDRFGITGTRWSPDGADIILKLRAVVVNGDLDDYMAYYKQRYLDLASAVGRLPSLRSGVNGQARRLAGTVAVQGS